MELGGKLALAVEALDRETIRHRDLKSSNILVRARDSEPVLVDFGSADYERGVKFTVGALPPGTTHYRSPESIRFQRMHLGDPNAHYVVPGDGRPLLPGRGDVRAARRAAAVPAGDAPGGAQRRDRVEGAPRALGHR